MKKKAILALAVGMILGLGFAQEETSDEASFSDFDTNTDMQVDMTEFTNSFGNYAMWDQDSTDGISSEEFNQGFWNSLDSNGDGIVGQDEWDNGMANWGDDSSPLADLDTDTNNEISQDEFASYTNTSFTTFDTDASGDVSETEYQEGVFGLIDGNADGMISEEEFNEAGMLLNSQDTTM